MTTLCKKTSCLRACDQAEDLANGKRLGVPATVGEQGIPHFNLADALNCYFQLGCTTFTRHELLAYGGMNLSRVQNCLRAWESRGFLQILKPLAGAEDAEIIVKLLHPIDEPRQLTAHTFLTKLMEKNNHFSKIAP